MKKIIFTAVIIAASFTTFAQVGIGTTNPEPSAVLDVSSTDKALLITRVADTSAITTPVMGMIVYSIAENRFKIYQENATVVGWYNLFN